MMNSLLSFPDEPPVADGNVGSDAGSLRYDDVVQDGRLRLESAWLRTGRVLFRNPEVAAVLSNLAPGITNVLSRITMRASEASLRPRAKVKLELKFAFEHTVDGGQHVDRLLLSTWMRASAEGRDGGEHPAAHVYGQRVFTRLHAAPGEHRVTRLPGLGASEVPSRRAVWEPATSLLALPQGAVPLDAAPRLNPARIVFGLSHTDLNQHVNFLMYHREVERAALNRFVDLGLGSCLLSREVSFGYRKPSFAGDVVRVALQAFRLGDVLGVVAALVEDDSGPAERAAFSDFGPPRNAAQMLLRP